MLKQLKAASSSKKLSRQSHQIAVKPCPIDPAGGTANRCGPDASGPMAAADHDETPIVWRRQRNRDRYEFLPALLEIMERPASPAGRTFIYVIVTFFAVLLAWAAFGRVDIVATAPGTLQPAGGAVIVQAGAPGTVSQILVSKGDRVREGAILMMLDDREATPPQAQIEERLTRQAVLALTNAHLLEMLGTNLHNRLVDIPLTPALRELAETQARARFATHESEVAGLSAQINELETERKMIRENLDARALSLPLYRQHEVNIASLAARGLARQAEWLEVQIALRQQEETRLRDQGNLKSIEARIGTLRASIDTQKLAARYVAVEAFLEAQQSGAIALTERDRLAASGERLIVRAPRAGTISEIAVTQGATIAQPGVAVLSLLPDDNLIAEVRLPSREIGFVTEGMSAAIKVDAYPYTRFGHLEGTVSAISLESSQRQDEVEPNFTIEIMIHSDELVVEGSHYPISFGMQVVADVRTGNRSVLDYFLSPITATVGETLRER